jgi:hypothetical protein
MWPSPAPEDRARRSPACQPEQGRRCAASPRIVHPGPACPQASLRYHRRLRGLIVTVLDALMAARRLRNWWYSAEADAVSARSREGIWRRRSIALGAFIVFGAVLLQFQFRHMDSVSDLGDPLFSVWRLGWVAHQIAGDPRALFDANIFHPARHTLALSDSMLLPGLIATPLLAGGIHPVTVLNVMLVASFLASACACYLLVEELTGSTGAAFIGGLLFAFHPFHYEHYSHFELLMTFWIPLSLLALHRFLKTMRVSWMVIAALLAVAQLYSSMYFAVYYLWIAAVVFGVMCAFLRPPVRRILGAVTVAGALAIAMALPLAREYKSAGLPDRPIQEVAQYSAAYSDYFRGHTRSAVWADRPLAHAANERALFPGAVVLILAVISLIPPVGPTRIAYASAAFMALEITRGTNTLIYPLLYRSLPFMRGLRVPARASLLVGLALAVLAGFAVRRVIAGRSPGVSASMLTALAMLIAVDLYPSIPLERVWTEPPSIYEAVRGRGDAVLAEFPLGLSPGASFTDTPHMYFSLWHWAQLINGYSGHAPAGYSEFQVAMRPFPAPETLALLHARGTTHVTVNCALYLEGCDELMQRMDILPELHLQVSTRWQGKPVRLYELIEPPVQNAIPDPSGAVDHRRN